MSTSRLVKRRRKDNLDAEDAPSYDDSETTLEAATQLAMLENLSPEQLDQYEAFRRSHFHADALRQVIADFNESRRDSHPGSQVRVDAGNPEMVIMLQGLAKVFVGSLVETARVVSSSSSSSTEESATSEEPLLPRHYRESYSRIISSRCTDRQEGTGLIGPSPRIAAAHIGPLRLMSGAPQMGPPDGSIL
mmetsp:Transcript_54706/g.108579  ORF Transcript_54706/g.108579 Transcript_54706/m.108579 type:complete len:191 (+) Transcript_54706:191-763(+)|eukprot:CAMPEP_0171630818 /NCGR_PEP_ID=MMETSP0990-20121206/23205_1 /TAXON_ID=483369 /ORGANISM="non described non described, Strain CCMP2098" /LENGTH=190 /DNA_ID=CAMNT_0012200159 /DNA_START=160 /DNA_END=732 /DNA_ORIENTATION=-